MRTELGLNQKSERNVPIFDDYFTWEVYALRVRFFSSASVIPHLRASCFIRRMYLRLPWEGRLRFGFSGV